MSTVVDTLKAVGYRFTRLTIGAGSNPTATEVTSWLNESIRWLLGICAEERSDLGRTLGSITTIKATITAITNDNPGSVTATAHGIGSAGAVGLIKDVSGMIEVNDTWFTLTYVDANTVTIGVDTSSTSSYTPYTSGGYIYVAEYTDLASDMYAPCEMVDDNGDLYAGWIKKSTSRNPLQLTTESASINYNPTGVAEPDKFYLDASGNVTFLQTPNDDYTVKIPYWQVQTERSTPHAITAITKANPGQITTDAYAFETSDSVYIEGVGGMTDVNGNTYTLTTVDASAGTYTIGVNTSSYGTYTTGGHATLATSTANYTMPFGGLFDDLIIQSLVLRIQNKEDNDPENKTELVHETNWLSFLSEKAKRLIRMRKGQRVGISL